MKPIVNTDVKMSEQMLDALTLFETHCVGSLTKKTNESEVKSFLTAKFGEDVASKFKTKYLY